MSKKCKGCGEEIICFYSDDWHFMELGYCSSICYHENTLPPEEEVMVSLEGSLEKVDE